jgi:hypothetical protein
MFFFPLTQFNNNDSTRFSGAFPMQTRAPEALRKNEKSVLPTRADRSLRDDAQTAWSA